MPGIVVVIFGEAMWMLRVVASSLTGGKDLVEDDFFVFRGLHTTALAKLPMN